MNIINGQKRLNIFFSLSIVEGDLLQHKANSTKIAANAKKLKLKSIKL